MVRVSFFVIFFISLMLTLSCQETGGEFSLKRPGVDKLFRLVETKTSGITFQNALPESSHMNRFVYEYFYNGGGVAIGDVNNDGLDDIYFTSNLKDNKLYLNKGRLQFEDITAEAQVAGKKGWATGVTMVDINQDGLLDIYIARAGRFTDEDKRRNELFINQGTDGNNIPTFQESAVLYGLDDPSFTTQASFFDYDRDGDLDVFMANHNIEAPPVEIKRIKELLEMGSPLGGNKLYQNHNGKFEDVTKRSGIHSHMMNYTLGVSIGDVNTDGWPDIYVANDYSEADHLYLNNGDGTFKDVIGYSVGHMPNFSMGCDMADINNDNMPDIISLDMVAEDNYGIKTSMSGMNVELFRAHVDAGLHHQYMYNALQLNNGCNENGQPLFSEIGQLSGISSTDWSWAPLLVDFDNDGLNDLYITNGVKRDFRNNDFNIFLRKATQKVIDEEKNPLKYYAQWTQFSPTRQKANYAFRNDGNLRFSNVSQEWGLDHLSFSNGAAYGDLDNDGDLDLVVNNIDSVAFLYENQSDKFKDSHYLSIRLKGSAQNRSGIGAKVAITSKGTIRMREQYLTRGFQSSVSDKLHFGLGNTSEIEKLIVIWPDGKQQSLRNIKADRQIVLDYANAADREKKPETEKQTLFSDITDQTSMAFHHKENEFDDFKREGLLPHKMSRLGPALAVGDVNNDRLDDIYIGGAMGQAGKLFIQKSDGSFNVMRMPAFEKDKKHEDVAGVFFDADQDGDLDLYLVSGGNEHPPGSSYYMDRFYENRLGQFIKNDHALPSIGFSGGCVAAQDYDNDGDQDLFLGGRQMPGKYPNPENSYIFRNDSGNGKIRFTDVSPVVAPVLQQLGMVTDALWADVDQDGWNDLMIVGEWMSVRILKNDKGKFHDITDNTGLSAEVGWWNCIAAADFDKDGDMDFIAGNLGLNYKYKATKDSPFEIYASDFDHTGTHDIVLGYYNNGDMYPLRGRECSSEQMPFIKEKFPSYDAFGKATILEVYGEENLSKSINYKATNFATCYIENLGNGIFDLRPLDNLAQLTSVNSIEVADVNHDGHLDIVLAGNMYNSEVETPRNDAGYGLCMSGDGKGNFKALVPGESGLMVKGEVRKTELIRCNRQLAIAFAKNDDRMQIFEIEKDK